VPGWLRGTIRLRLTALAAVLLATVLALSAVGLVTVQRRQLIANVDATLEQRADDIAGTDDPPERLGPGQLDGFAQLVAVDGRVIAASANLAGRPPLPVSLEPGRDQAIRTVTGLPVDDDEFRVLSRRISTAGEPALLHVGANLGDATEGVAVLATSLAAGVPVVVVLLTLLVWWLAGRLLAPVERIRSEVASINVSQRVREPPGDDEIARLARTMNGMLDRLEDSSSRQQRFVADASHELRSPLTRIRTELEVDGAAAHRSVLAEVIGLQRLVDDLLRLARADAGVVSDRREPVDLDDLVLREVRRIRAAGRVELDIAGVSAAQVTGDPDQLARAVRNLVDNAERHATGRVTLTLAERDGRAVFTVEDDGPGIPVEARERIFERFGRLDGARARDRGGAGLGLAITREIVQRHGGTVAVEARSRFVVRLPVAR
jgi:signal transduction histidine kinase